MNVKHWYEILEIVGDSIPRSSLRVCVFKIKHGVNKGLNESHLWNKKTGKTVKTNRPMYEVDILQREVCNKHSGGAK